MKEMIEIKGKEEILRRNAYDYDNDFDNDHNNSIQYNHVTFITSYKSKLDHGPCHTSTLCTLHCNIVLLYMVTWTGDLDSALSYPIRALAALSPFRSFHPRLSCSDS